MTRCEWCKRDGCRDHESTKVFPLGSPTFEEVGPAPRTSGYVRSREALIPEAERIADQTVGPHPPGHHRSRFVLEWCDRWNRAFHAAMEYLWGHSAA